MTADPPSHVLQMVEGNQVEMYPAATGSASTRAITTAAVVSAQAASAACSARLAPARAVATGTGCRRKRPRLARSAACERCHRRPSGRGADARRAAIEDGDLGGHCGRPPQHRHQHRGMTTFFEHLSTLSVNV